MFLRKVDGASVRVEREDGDAVVVGRGPEVVLRGEPIDLLLYLFGRKGAAQVEITGDTAARTALEAASLGL
jgi:hypothetical protein